MKLETLRKFTGKNTEPTYSREKKDFNKNKTKVQFFKQNLIKHLYIRVHYSIMKSTLYSTKLTISLRATCRKSNERSAI